MINVKKKKKQRYGKEKQELVELKVEMVRMIRNTKTEPIRNAIPRGITNN